MLIVWGLSPNEYSGIFSTTANLAIIFEFDKPLCENERWCWFAAGAVSVKRG